MFRKHSSQEQEADSLGWLAVLPLLAVTLGFILVCRTFLNHDVAWVLYGSGVLLDGGWFGREIVAANPPLIWWMYHVPNIITRVVGMPVEHAFRVFVTALAVLSLVASNRLLREGCYSRELRVGVLVLCAVLFTVGTYRDFGQREHITAMLSLPYILAASRRFEGEAVAGRFAFFIGMAAGLGIALKPYFALVPLFVEGALFLRRRKFSLLWRPEALGAVMSVIAYAAAILIFAREWLFEAVPAISKVYWAFEQASLGYVPNITLQFLFPLCMGGVIALISRKNLSSMALLCLLASVAFLLAAVIQAKYYSYHLYPAYTFVLIGISLQLRGLATPFRQIHRILVMLILAMNLITPLIWLKASQPGQALYQRTAELTAFVQYHVPADEPFLAVSTHPYPGFPVSLYAGRHWSSTSNSRLFCRQW